MKSQYPLLVLLLSFGFLRAEAQMLPAHLEDLAHSSLKFIAEQQFHAGNGLYTTGEWPTQVYSSVLPVLVGVGDIGHDQEPTAFTTGSVVNQLAVIHALHPEFTEIAPMIHLAVPALDRYREGDLYNFYPARISGGVRVHQAAAMALSPLWKGFTNVPEDADTSSVSYAARVFESELGARGHRLQLPEGVLQSFSTYRDVNRTPDYYDRDEGLVDTGAFMTWQYDEKNPDMPRFYFADPQAGARIPFNINDVDCIVNLNVLRLLALTGNSSLTGHDQACAMLDKVVQKSEYSSCGIYYPNTYNFAYSAALAEEAGETCLSQDGSQIAQFILSKQSNDGGWDNIHNLWVSDRVQATAFALYGLSQFGDTSDLKVRRALVKGANFLLTQSKVSPTGNTYWPGEIFFTATALARSLVVWRSDSFTTAVVLSSLLKVHDRIGWEPSR